MSAEEFLPQRADRVADLMAAAAHCEGCDLFRSATQTVFGQGRVRKPALMLVGEQPGDVEDRTGEPFVGPAGAMLDQALEAVGLERNALYVTNAVKHFKWEPKGNRRLHKSPSAREVAACRPWLMAEIAAVRPRVIVCLGSTATHSLLGRDGVPVVPTVHPSSILRLRERESRHKAYDGFVADLQLAARVARSDAAHPGVESALR